MVKSKRTWVIAAVLGCSALMVGCVNPGPRMSFEERYPHAQCRYEASVATANMGCVGCIEQNIAKFQALDDLYHQCVALKR